MNADGSRNRIPVPFWAVLAIALLMVALTLCNRPKNRPGRAAHQEFANKAYHSETFERTSSRLPSWTVTDCEVWELLFSPNDRYLAATVASVIDGEVSRNYRVRVFDLVSQKVIFDVPVFFKVMICFSARSEAIAIFGPNSQRLQKGMRGEISIYRTVDGAIHDKLDITEPGWWQTVDAIGLSEDSRCIAAQFVSSKMYGASEVAWELTSKQPVEFHPDRFRWSGRRYSLNRDLRFGGGWPGPGIRILRGDSGKVVSFCLWDTGPSAAPAFLTDSRMFAAAYPDGKFVVWDIRESEGRPILQKTGFENCTAFAISHSMEHLAIGASDGTIRIAPFEIAALESSLDAHEHRQCK